MNLVTYSLPGQYYTFVSDLPYYKVLKAQDSLLQLSSIRSSSNEDAQIAINGFFEDMWFLFESSFPKDILDNVQKTMKRFGDRFPDVVCQYMSDCDAEYGVPLFCTLLIRWVSISQNVLENDQLENALQYLQEAISQGDECLIAERFKSVVFMCSDYALRAMDYYTPFDQIPHIKTRVAQESLSLLLQETDRVEETPLFWEEREVGFLVSSCGYEDGHVFKNVQDRHYQTALCGFFDDMWSAFGPSFAEKTHQKIKSSQDQFYDRFRLVVERYERGSGFKYDTPLFQTIVTRLMQSLPHPLEAKEILDGFESCRDAIEEGSQEKIRETFEVFTLELSSFALRFLETFS